MTLASASPLMQQVGWLLVHSVWEFAAIALVLAIVLRALRGATAGTRYVLALIGWGAMLVAPAGTWFVLPAPVVTESAALVTVYADRELSRTLVEPHPPYESGLTSVRDSGAVPASDVGAPGNSVPEGGTPAVEPAASWTDSLRTLIAPWLNTLVVIWCLGVSAFATRSARGWYVVRRLLHRDVTPVPPELAALLTRVAAQIGLRGPVRLLQSSRVDVPLVVGWLRPVILLPVCVATGFSPQQLEAILAHELAHVRRHDYLINLLQNLSETVRFYHPALWWASAVVRREREHCCDELAARALGNRAEYGRALLALEELRGTAPTLAFGAKGGSLLERIRRLAQMEPTPRLGAGGVIGIALVAAVVVGAVMWGAGAAGGRADEASADKKAEKKTFIESIEQASNPAVEPVSAAAGDGPKSAQAAEQQPTTTYKGTVVDPHGQPLADAHVRVYEAFTWTEHFLADTRTDKDGRFEIRGIPQEQEGRWYCNLIVSSPAFATRVMMPATIGESEIALEIALSEPATLRGRVVGPHGEPVAGADVFCPSFKEPVPGAHSAKTDANGYFQITDLEPWDGIEPVATGGQTQGQRPQLSSNNSRSLRIQHPDYGRAIENYRSVPSKHIIQLQPPIVVSGRVLNSRTREPLADILVAAGNSSTTSDAEGKYWLLIQSREKTPIEVKTYQLGWSEASAPVQAAPGDSVEVDDLLIESRAKVPTSSDSSADASGTESKPNTHGSKADARVDITIIQAKNVLLLDGKQIVTWKEIDEKIAALPDPSRVHPQLYVTRGASEAKLWDAAWEQVAELARKYGMNGQSVGSLTPRTDIHYDRIKTPADLIPDASLRREGTVTDQDGKPIAGAEVVLITPVDDSLSYKTYDVVIVSGRVRNPVDEVLTHTDAAGKFAVYPPKDAPFRVLALHADKGIALADSDQFIKDSQVKLLPWGGVVAEFSQEPEQQEASLRTHLDERDGRPEISITQYWVDLKRPDPTLKFEFTHVPPIWSTSISRDFRQPDGGSTGVAGASVSMLPGETRTITLGPVTKQQRELLKSLDSVLKPRADAGNAAASGVAQAEDAARVLKSVDGDKSSSAQTDESRSAPRPSPYAPTSFLKGIVLDEAGQPVSGAHVEAHYFRGVATVNSNENGQFTMGIATENVRSLNVLVRSFDRQRSGITQLAWDVNTAKPPEVTVTMKPAVRADVHVMDGDRQPVANAKVTVRMNGHCRISLQTDPKGRAAIMLPADAQLDEVLARKAGLSIDYHALFNRARAARKLPQMPDLSRPIELVLTRTQPLTVTLRDAATDAPVDDTPVNGWTLRKPGESNELYTSSYPNDLEARTDADGVAVIDWLPAWAVNSQISLSVSSRDYEQLRTEYRVVDRADVLTIKLQRLVSLSGRVTFVDGRPAAGIPLLAIGEGYNHESFRSKSVNTDADGRYEVNVEPNKAYFVHVAATKEWAAPLAADFVILPGKPKQNVDLVLRPATRIFGRVTIGPNHEPVAGQEIVSYQSTPIVDLRKAGVELPADADQIWASPSFAIGTKADSDGRFEFFVGPGKYDLRGPKQNEIEQFEITTETEREFNFDSPRSEEGPFTGLVVAGDPPRPVANAKVNGVYRHQLSPIDLEATTDAEGRFNINRALHATVLNAVSDDKSQAAIVEVGPDDETVTLTLQPRVKAAGRLINVETKEPLPGATIQYYTRVHLGGKDDPFRQAFGGSVKTDENGRFELDRLVAGQDYDVTLVAGRDASGYANRWDAVTTLAPATPGETIDLGDVARKSEPKPQTFADRTAAAFRKPDSATTRLQNGLRDIRIGHLRLLLIVADPDAELTQQFFKLRYEDEDVRPATDNYWLVPLPLTGDKADDTRALVQSLGIEVSDSAAPVFVLIDEEKQRLATVEAKDFSTDGAIDKQKVLDFLAAHVPTQLDAQVLFDDALARAKTENKRVFIQESATWCGPCWMLSRFIAAHRDVLEQDYVFVKLDHRWPHAQEIAKQFQKEPGGIPWCAILDADQNVLATSDGPDGNIGYPSKEEPKGIEHFLKMLRDSRIRLTDADLDGLRAALEGKAAAKAAPATTGKTSQTDAKPPADPDRDTDGGSKMLREIRRNSAPLLAALAEKHGYGLKEGEDVKLVPMPFDPARMEYYRVGQPGQAEAIPRGPDSMLFHSNAESLTNWSMSFGDSDNPGQSIAGLCEWILDRKSQDLEGPSELLKQRIPGDWVLRLGAPEESRLKQLNAILLRDAPIAIRLGFRTVKRPVYVARGTYKLTPLPGHEGEDRTQLTEGVRVSDKLFIFGAETPNADSGAGGGCGDFREFLSWIGRWIEAPVIGEVEVGPTRGLCWSLHEVSPFTQEQHRLDHDPDRVLANVTKQTGLTFEKSQFQNPLRIVNRQAR